MPTKQVATTQEGGSYVAREVSAIATITARDTTGMSRCAASKNFKSLRRLKYFDACSGLHAARLLVSVVSVARILKIKTVDFACSLINFK